MRILIGTNNKNKLNQFIRIFNELKADIKLLSLREEGITDDVEEDNDNLLENAVKKAKYYGEKSGMLTLSDDTGLFIDALNGEPGVHSKRWHRGTDEDRYRKILEKMENVSYEKRTCKYTGVLAVYDHKTNKLWTYKNDLEGMIAEKPIRGNGFGYDPIFVPVNYKKHYSQLTDKERDEISHRGSGIKEFLLVRRKFFDGKF